MGASVTFVFGSMRRALLAWLIVTAGVVCVFLQLVSRLELNDLVLTLSCLLLLLSIFFGKPQWFYSIFAGQFLLGVWIKVMVHRHLDSPYIEPTGRFSFSAEAWTEFTTYAAGAALGLVAGRILTVILTARKASARTATSACLLTAPRVSTSQWLLFVGSACCLYVLNEMFSLYVSGVNPKLTLPLGLNAPLSFMIFIGVPLAMCWLVSIDIRARGELTVSALLSVLTLLLVSSVSTASRAPLVTQALPILLAALLMQREMGRTPIRWTIFVTWALFLVSSLALVSVVRIFAYIDDAVLDADTALFYVEQTASLFLDRWLGAEAIMSAIGEGSKSLWLFAQLLVEDPAAGTDALYQQISDSPYTFSSEYTFATWPGFLGIVSLSGSVTLVLACSAAVVCFGQWLERAFEFLLGHQPVTVALAASTVSFWIYQTTVPRLFFPFMFQLLIFAGILGVLNRSTARSRRRRNPVAPRLSFE